MEQLLCERCESEVQEGDKFCPNCGSLFENMNCTNHTSVEAEGVCVICSKPFCDRCGDTVDDLFLCYDHENYEILQGHARVRGSSDEASIGFLNECLESEGLHPVVFNRKNNPWHMGSGDYTLFRASGEFDGNLVNEIKLMVPYNEVLRAEEIIKGIENAETESDNAHGEE